MKEFYTSAELAEKFDMAKPSMDFRLRKLGIRPEIPAVDTLQGRTPAWYNLDALAKVEQSIWAEKTLKVTETIDALCSTERTSCAQCPWRSDNQTA